MQKRFNHYCLTEQLDSKPLRSVYLAHHIKDVSHKMLLKIFDAPCLALGQENERFLHQVEWIKQLRHAHVVPILDLGVEQGQPYVVSTYLAGGSLRRRLDSLSLRRLPLPAALKIILQIGQALAYFHEHAYLHENIKPENIFFDAQGEILLTDFRLSGFIDVKLLDYQSDPRSMCYMAPEQFAGAASEKSDQYALACLAYELITGREPFSAQSFAMMWASHYAEVPAPLTDLVPDLPPSIEKAVFKAMAKNPSERYPNISAFLHALQSAPLALIPAITGPLTISALDPFAASVVQSLASIQSEFLIHTSLMGNSFEGSLANAPFSTSMPGISFVTNLAVTPFETSMAGVPFGTSMVGNPFGASMANTPFETSMTGVPFGTSMVGNPFGTSMARSSFGMNLADAPFETSQEDDSPGMAQGGNPFEMLLDTPLTTRLLERWEHMSNEPAKTTDTLARSSHSGALPYLFRNTKYSIPAFWLGNPRKRSTRVDWFSQLRGYLENLRKRSTRMDWFPQLKSYLENLHRRAFGQGSSSLTLWLVLAMTVTVLIGGIVSNTFLAPHSSGRNSNYKQQIIDTKGIPIDTRLISQPITHSVTTPTMHTNPQKEIHAKS